MTMSEFCKKYCGDILKRVEKYREKEVLEEFPYDTMKQDENGTMVKYIISLSGNKISIDDIISSDLEEFSVKYPNRQDIEAYENYINGLLEHYEITVGLDILLKRSEAIKRQKAEIELFAQASLEQGALEPILIKKTIDAQTINSLPYLSVREKQERILNLAMIDMTDISEEEKRAQKEMLLLPSKESLKIEPIEDIE